MKIFETFLKGLCADWVLGASSIDVETILGEVLFCTQHDGSAVRYVQLNAIGSVLPGLANDGEEDLVCWLETIEATKLMIV